VVVEQARNFEPASTRFICECRTTFAEGVRGAGNESAVRRYDDEDIRRLRFIRSAQAAGFSLEEIAELLALDASDDRPRARALARERILALNAKIAELEAARKKVLMCDLYSTWLVAPAKGNSISL
jgi:DNA-binding transcriptional MerR regulator